MRHNGSKFGIPTGNTLRRRRLPVTKPTVQITGTRKEDLSRNLKADPSDRRKPNDLCAHNKFHSKSFRNNPLDAYQDYRDFLSDMRDVVGNEIHYYVRDPTGRIFLVYDMSEILSDDEFDW